MSIFIVSLITGRLRGRSEKHPPEHEDEAEPDDGAEYDRVLPLLEVNLLHEVVDEREAVGDVVELEGFEFIIPILPMDI